MTGQAPPQRLVGEGGRRAARRAFIRTHHPDVGGDLETYLTGLAVLERCSAGPEVVFVSRPRGAARLSGWLRVLHCRPLHRRSSPPRVR